MGKLEDYNCGNMVLKILSKLPYRIECMLEELIFKLFEGMKGDISDLDNLEISDIKGFDITKKIAINDFLLQNAVFQPKITPADLDDDEHHLNDKFREVGDFLFEKYIGQYAEKMAEKKKVMK